MTKPLSELIGEQPCERCEGKGWYWRVPDGFNPFYAGGFATARAMFKASCSCRARAFLETRDE